MRLREIKKELVKQESLMKRSQADFDRLSSSQKEDTPLGRLLFNRIEKCKEEINRLKKQ